ncbi:protein kinase domain-containing protein [Gordonia bronchialis]|uniref:protein kinase domain-containing protein n=1 Tax=Gordonia bronchialis TaxID=2054 RepID=UPI00226D8E85|nr:protein kinase [Gordonia bronchialis]
MSLQPGQSFAGYRIVRQLGAGGMGEVYLADHPRLPRQDALKILPSGLSGDAMFRKRFTREADVAASLDHPNIVSVFDRGEADGQLWITMKYVDGTDASYLLNSHPRGLPAGDVVAVISAVADALDYAHGQGLLHRDVKPANILIAGSADKPSVKRRILLADFGIARPIFDDTHITSTNLTVGSVAYTSPEQLSGTTLDGRADQYSLACTAYQLLCGATPFANSNAAMLIHQHLSVSPPPVSEKRPDLSGQVDRVLARALDKEPGRRYSSCEHFANDLASALRSGSAGATLLSKPTPAQPAPRPPRPRGETSQPQRPAPHASGPRPSPTPHPAPSPASLPAYTPPAYTPPSHTSSPYHAPATPRSDGKATASLVLGIVSLTIGWCGFSLLTGPAAIILGLVALRSSDRAPVPITNRGTATAGVITGILGTLAMIVFYILVIALDSSTTT